MVRLMVGKPRAARAEKRNFTERLLRDPRTRPRAPAGQEATNPLRAMTVLCNRLCEKSDLRPADAWLATRVALSDMRSIRYADIHDLFTQEFEARRAAHHYNLLEYIRFASLCTVLFFSVAYASELTQAEKLAAQALLIRCREGRTLLYPPPYPLCEDIIASMRRVMAGAYNAATAKVDEGDLGQALVADAQVWMVLIARETVRQENAESKAAIDSILSHRAAVLERCIEMEAMTGGWTSPGESRQIARMFLHSVVTGEHVCLRRDWDRFRDSVLAHR